MHILSDSEDRFHNVTSPGAYEWSYFDGLSEDGEWGFVAIWFRGIPMSPNYTAAIDRYFSRPTGSPPDPDDFTAFNLNIYHRGRRIYYALHERPRELWSGSTSGPDVRLAGNTVHAGSGPGGNRVYLLNFDTGLSWQRSRVVGDITVESRRIDLGEIAVPYDPLADGHFWVPAALDGTFNARLDLWRRGRGVEKLRFSGRAYHDRNFGTRPLHHLTGAWEWGRVHSKSDLFVYFMLAAQPGDDAPFGRMLLVRDGRLVASESGLAQIDAPRRSHWTGLSWPEFAAAEGASGHLGFRATPRRALDSGPFYHRHLSDFSVSLDGENVIASGGIAEYLLPSRLGVRFFRPFVRFRVRRG